MNFPKVLLVLLTITISTIVHAQSNSGTIKGRLQDSASKKGLSLATVTVFRAKDTSILTYRLSDQNGEFKVPALPLNLLCRVMISFSGYKVYRKEFELTKDNAQLDFGTITLADDPRLLDEVFVTAERPPVSIRKDTIEFNASAFKTLPSALVEDLLKKLPGIDIDPEGNIMVKGKQVNRLLVDGKEFFGGDAKIATKNLPANIVDKVQVMDDKEQIERNPDIAPADIGQIINIKLKRAIKQGWFGKAYAGGGTDSRYETGAIVNAFRDTTQVSFLAYSNNVNKAGFGINDLQKIGGFDRSGISSMSVSSQGGFAINGTSFGGGGQGIQRSTGGGININHQFRKTLTLNLQYFYGDVNSDFESLTNRQRFLQDTTQVVRSSGVNNSFSANHRVGGTLIWKIDSLTTLTFRPGLTLTKNRLQRNSFTDISDNFKGNLNSEENTQNSKETSGNYSHSLYLNKAFKKRGRMLMINNNLSVNDNLNDQYFDLVNVFYLDGTTIRSSQLRQRQTPNTNGYLNAAFTEPITKAISLRFGHTVNYTKESNALSPFNRNGAGKYIDLIDSLNSKIARTLIQNTTNAGLTWRKKDLMLTGSMNMLFLDYDNSYLKTTPVNRSFNYLYPSLTISFKGMQLSYAANIRAPSAYDLQPVIDNTNRQFLFRGNPALKPQYARNLSFNYFKFKPDGSSYSFYITGNRSDNAVIRENTIDKSGIQISQPVNVSGLNSLNGSINYTKQYKFNTNFRLSLRPGIYGNYNEGVVSFNGNRSGSETVNYSSSLMLGLNWKDIIELNQRYGLNMSKTSYDNKNYYKNIEVITHSAESEIIIRWPKHIVWETLINYSYNPQVSPGIRKSFVRWNGGVNYLFLKEDKGQLKISFFDLLNQNISVYRYTTENSILDSQTSTLRRYFLLSFIYNLRTFSPGKVGGRDRSFFLF
ncbi:outer membrane beta-barrel protein [Segetibacter sp. 3557_3]|uniref:outer membrane beta-barrel protein n=1 Tax=Segetibacter sp. 3557_3 TaxID=2547429 RepID=UPI001404C553|nr:outer membrane beta-barrel protein [Segetibacter sp. 3557_3]